MRLLDNGTCGRERYGYGNDVFRGGTAFFFRLYVGAGFVLIRRTITVSDDDDLFINFIRAFFIDKTNYVISGKNVEINWEIVN